MKTKVAKSVEYQKFVCGVENLTKGKPWPVDDERKLRGWYTSGNTDLRVLAFSFNGEYTEEAIRQKLIKFNLLIEQQPKKSPCC
jgi:hypothetical protein